MKKTTLFLTISFLSLYACKKEAAPSSADSINVIPASAVPAAVLISFNTSFSGAADVEWQHNNDDSFISQFNMDNERHEAGFDGQGHESSHSVICLDGAVPQAVITAFRMAFANDNVYEWNLTGEGTWKAHFIRGSVKWEAIFDSTGMLLKSEHD